MAGNFDTSELLAGLKKAQGTMLAAAAHAVVEFAGAVIGNAAKRAPVGGGPFSPNDPAPGTLKASATMEPPEISSTGISVKMGFNTVYAARQHEELDWNHDQGEAKYLENALREFTPKFGPHIADALKEATG